MLTYRLIERDKTYAWESDAINAQSHWRSYILSLISTLLEFTMHTFVLYSCWHINFRDLYKITIPNPREHGFDGWMEWFRRRGSHEELRHTTFQREHGLYWISTVLRTFWHGRVISIFYTYLLQVISKALSIAATSQHLSIYITYLAI